MADKKFYVDVVVPDEVYDATGWNGDLSVPTKNAVRDKIESIPALTDGDKGDITVSSSGTVWTADADAVVKMTGNQTIAGVKTFSSVVTVPVGSVGGPSVNFATDLTTGMYQAGAGVIGFATAGVASVGISAATLSISGANVALNMIGSTSNTILYNTNGVAAPTFTTRSAGNKIVLYPAISGSVVDGAIGIDTNTVWFSTFTTGAVFKWYGGTTLAATLTGAGALTLVGALSAANINVTGTNTAVNLNGSASNVVIWNVNGQNPPAFTTRSAGTKIVLYPSISGAAVDTAIGTNGTGVMWQSIGTSAGAFYWYAATTQIASMTGAGDLSVTGGMAGDYFAAAAGGSGSPSISVDGTNGLYSPSSNVLGLSAGNVSRIVINSTSISNTLPLYGQDGSNTAPTYAFTNATGSGMYLSTTNTLGFTTNSTLRVSISTASVTSTIPFRAANGASGSPAYSFSGESTTGMYHTGVAGTLGFVTSGNPVLTLNNSRQVIINDQYDVEVMNWMTNE